MEIEEENLLFAGFHQESGQARSVLAARLIGDSTVGFPTLIPVGRRAAVSAPSS